MVASDGTVSGKATRSVCLKLNYDSRRFERHANGFVPLPWDGPTAYPCGQ